MKLSILTSSLFVSLLSSSVVFAKDAPKLGSIFKLDSKAATVVLTHPSFQCSGGTSPIQDIRLPRETSGIYAMEGESNERILMAGSDSEAGSTSVAMTVEDNETVSKIVVETYVNVDAKSVKQPTVTCVLK